jgi:signal peptidase II
MVNKTISHVRFFGIALVLVLLDQIFKFWAQITAVRSEILPKVGIFYSVNYGAGFGILQNQQPLLILIGVGVIFLILYKYKTLAEGWKVPASLILGGALGNLVDRFVFGFVRDFISIWIWPSFNLADAAITVGVGWILYLEYVKK